MPDRVRTVCKTPVVGVSLLCALLLGYFHSQLRANSVPLQRYEFSLQRMGTMFDIILYAPSRNDASLAANAAFDRIEQLEQSMSDYRPDSELNHLCKEGVWNPRPVSQELYFVLDTSIRISRLTGGAFDVTVGPEVALWREARRAKQLPDTRALAKAREAVGYENLELDPAAHTVLLKRDDMRLDLGGIAKGFAADEAVKLLKSRGIRSALVHGGGNMMLGDAPPGTPGWKIAVDDPGSDLSRHKYLMLHNVGVGTSGDAYQHLDMNGRRYSHVVNPADGMGISDSLSTTVLAPDGITADALALGLSILPVSEALKVADSIEGVSATLTRRVGSDVRSFSSRKFPRLLESTKPQPVSDPGTGK
ncbi:MAG TPA: FAD:protein FMN transferase [Acidobacteriota bacterium]|nr:FAD:protein FMN transferase [Acidobacteriota bacterium]